MSEVAVPAKLSGVVLSPQSTVILETSPSTSAVVNVTVTVAPVLAGFGAAGFTVAIGGRSFTVTGLEADAVEPLLSVAVIVMVNAWFLELPVEA